MIGPLIDCYRILVIHIWFFCVNIVKFIEIIFLKMTMCDESIDLDLYIDSLNL